MRFELVVREILLFYSCVYVTPEFVPDSRVKRDQDTLLLSSESTHVSVIKKITGITS